MKGPEIKKLENKDLNEFRDELFSYMAMLLNAQSRAQVKILNGLLVELQKILISVHNDPPVKKKTAGRRKTK